MLIETGMLMNLPRDELLWFLINGKTPSLCLHRTVTFKIVTHSTSTKATLRGDRYTPIKQFGNNTRWHTVDAK